MDAKAWDFKWCTWYRIMGFWVFFCRSQVFHDVAYKAKDRNDLVAGIDEFLDQVTVLPPGEWDPSIRIEPPKNVPSQVKRSIKTTLLALLSVRWCFFPGFCLILSNTVAVFPPSLFILINFEQPFWRNQPILI